MNPIITKISTKKETMYIILIVIAIVLTIVILPYVNYQNEKYINFHHNIKNGGTYYSSYGKPIKTRFETYLIQYWWALLSPNAKIEDKKINDYGEY